MGKKENVRHEHITDEELEAMAGGKLPDAEVNAINKKLNQCVFCKREFMIFWANRGVSSKTT